LSDKYPDLELTNFPNSVDTISEKTDPSSESDLTLINTYKGYIEAGNYSAAISYLASHPDLINMMITKDDINKMLQMILAIERYYFEDVQSFLLNLAGIKAENITFNDDSTIEAFYQSLKTLVTNRALVSDSTGKVATSSVTSTELDYLSGVTNNIQTQLNSKQNTITGGASTITSSDLTPSRALASNSSGKVAASSVTSTELGYLSGVTGNIQTQLDSKLASSTYTPSDVKLKLLTVDGAGSGVDADLLDGRHASEFELLLNADQKRKITISTSDPSGGSHGDIWLKYAP